MINKSLIKMLAALLIAVAMLIPMLSACDLNPNESEVSIYIASDLHLYSNNLVGKNNERYIKENFTNDGRIQEHDYSVVKALVDTVNVEKPEFLVLTGDLSFNGEKDSHLELAKLLSEVGDHTRVLVIPGNHDTYSYAAVSVLDDTTQQTDTVNDEEFREIYKNFGYSGAYSYDESTLSYIYKIDDDKWALMLDTSLARNNAEGESAIVGGYLGESTLLWLENNLKEAKEKGITVISFTHHNLLVHNPLFESSYTLSNNQELLKLYAEYGVKLNFSGHLHIQSIKSETVEGSTVYDVSSGSLLDYGNRYGMLAIYADSYSYHSRLLDLKDYGESLRGYSFNTFYQEYYNKTLPGYAAKLGEADGKEVTHLLAQINAYYFDGSYTQIHRLIGADPELLELIKENTLMYDSSYVKSIIDVPNEDQHGLVFER